MSQNKDKPYVFFRGDVWYPIEMHDDDDAIKNALHNVGTTKVEDMNGKVIWELQNGSEPLPLLNQEISECIWKKGIRIAFGLERQGHIPTIEAMLKEHEGSSKYVWELIGKKNRLGTFYRVC